MSKEDEKYFLIVSEIDYIHWRLSDMLQKEKSLSAIEKMIDEASGFDKEKMKTAKALITRCKKLKLKLEKLEA